MRCTSAPPPLRRIKPGRLDSAFCNCKAKKKGYSQHYGHSLSSTTQNRTNKTKHCGLIQRLRGTRLSFFFFCMPHFFLFRTGICDITIMNPTSQCNKLSKKHFSFRFFDCPFFFFVHFPTSKTTRCLSSATNKTIALSRLNGSFCITCRFFFFFFSTLR